MSRYDDDALVCPPEPKSKTEGDPKWFEDFEREWREKQAQEAKQKAAYEKRTRNYKITESAAIGGDPYPEEE